MINWSLEYSFDVDEDKSVIYVKVVGRWTAETAANYHQDFIKALEPIKDRPWAKLVDLTKWKTSRNEVTSVLGKHMAWSRENDVSLSLYVVNHPSTYRQLNEMFVAGGTKDVSHTFRTLEQAQKFLKENWLDRQK